MINEYVISEVLNSVKQYSEKEKPPCLLIINIDSTYGKRAKTTLNGLCHFDQIYSSQILVLRTYDNESTINCLIISDFYTKSYIYKIECT